MEDSMSRLFCHDGDVASATEKLNFESDVVLINGSGHKMVTAQSHIMPLLSPSTFLLSREKTSGPGRQQHHSPGEAMASATATKRMREEATCSICLSLMTEPQIISCGHSFCQWCIEDFLDNQQPNLRQHPCPQCRAPFNRTSLRPNKQLGSLIEVIKELDQEMTCKEHGEKLHLFDKDNGQLICWRCAWSPQNRWCTSALVEDVCPGYKRKVNLQRQKIQDDFKNLHSFLQQEEKSFLWRLEKENEQTLKPLRDSEASLECKRRELESHIQHLEDRCQGSAQKLLQDVKGALSRSSAVKLENPEALSLEIQTVCDVSELYFDVRQLLRGYQVDVTLDPETAHRKLILSEDQRQVTKGRPQCDVHDSPRRFTAYPCVLGHEGFASGRHYFEVYVGKETQWGLGVCMENVQRDTRTKLKPQSGFWAISLSTKASYTALKYPPTFLHLWEQPLLVGVFLDYEAGAVSFYNMTTPSHIFTFPRASFSGTLRPYFHVYPSSHLSLPPPEMSKKRSQNH
ncbi:PREDICTED: E3 ubiquitin-protein ligase TRIM38-like isoform X2 [Hipposideros armiger]|uniref:E3 ubiquitin-protein ligase TRIM38-like isoform X2 n=1 Tax=Hipposideros armiger TaxID=186990 RepID=A0A8B7QIX4_HIPAR|nr:PREDICTED: E3 ubiquitin-protein ligase TRIM38-like isoform X2 [Hipposideros armiger]